MKTVLLHFPHVVHQSVAHFVESFDRPPDSKKCAIKWTTKSLGQAVAILTLATCAHASVTNVAWYRLGENDPGAASGHVVNSSTMDFVGTNHLKRFGSPLFT